MSRTQITQENGFFGIGILNNVDELNIGTLWRSAYILGASFIFTVDRKYKKQSSDISNAWTKIPLYHYRDMPHLKDHIPHATQIIAVEMTEDAQPLPAFKHPERALYLLGNEQSGLPDAIIEQAQHTICLPGQYSLNVAVAGSLVMYDRVSKRG